MNVIFLLAAYLIGSIPTALIVGKLFFKIDIREHGSNNPGATNTIRVLGKRAGLIVLIVDIGKGALAAALPLLFHLDMEPLTLGLIAVVGHCFPIFAHFRGGKAIATTAGALLIVNPWMLLIAYVTFFGVIFITKYVFLGSISVGVALLIYSFFQPGMGYELIFFLFIIFLLFLHRSNIRNFIAHKEPKINDKKVKDDRIKK
ncbi:glycerol-3-phosphate 1-O-acyltransferase PlsY [Robertmurraya sp. DFI.2.37]|uniref:glycerol-3-phosphate 1-O-acyltransferase PlsY n=1 Tax=Robertmurraya sp. DFI.2.37 TaxID=3031819 RepID=UPI001247CD56|nr:glycerol-3-phosphate 1-O-acyltransferase PlsY [Robertmurraya sp. DFI.2.37]MDF1509758.1 glycerol-3-phosphate 1-O-acyltransferase PlsY [Robertmurraya sp. DFI.2.37]